MCAGRAWYDTQLKPIGRYYRFFSFSFKTVSPNKTIFWSRISFATTLWLLVWIFVQKVFETNLNYRHQWVRIQTLVIYVSTFKIDITKGPLFCQIVYSLVPKTVSNTFQTKTAKSSHCGAARPGGQWLNWFVTYFWFSSKGTFPRLMSPSKELKKSGWFVYFMLINDILLVVLIGGMLS